MTGGYKPDIHHRRSIRLKGYDYAQAGAYFVTIAAHQRQCRFGEVVNETMHLNDQGRIVHTTWSELPCHYQGALLDAFVVMPNHVHGIIVLNPGAQFTVSDSAPMDACVGARFIAPSTVFIASLIIAPNSPGITRRGIRDGVDATMGAMNRAPTVGETGTGIRGTMWAR